MQRQEPIIQRVVDATDPVQRESGGCSRDGTKTGPSVQKVQKMVEVRQIAFSKIRSRFLFLFFEVFRLGFFEVFSGLIFGLFFDFFSLSGSVVRFFWGQLIFDICLM